MKQRQFFQQVDLEQLDFNMQKNINVFYILHKNCLKMDGSQSHR